MSGRPENIQQPAADEVFDIAEAAGLAAPESDTARLLRELGGGPTDSSCPDWAKGPAAAPGKARPYSALDAMYGAQDYDDPDYGANDPYEDDPYYADDPYYGSDPYAKGDAYYGTASYAKGSSYYGPDSYAEGGSYAAPRSADLEQIGKMVATVDDTTVGIADRVRTIQADTQDANVRLGRVSADVGALRAELREVKQALAALTAVIESVHAAIAAAGAASGTDSGSPLAPAERPAVPARAPGVE